MARRALILALAGSLFFFFYQQHRFRGLRDPSAMDHAQLGRALAEGRGYRTRLVRPWIVGTLERGQRQGLGEADPPELERPPLYPLALAGGFRWLRPDFQVPRRGHLFAPETRVIVPFGWLCTLATALLLYWVANRWFDRRIAGLAPIVFLLSRTVLQRSLSGLPDPLSALLATGSMGAVLLVAPVSGSPGSDPGAIRAGGCALLAGVLAGLAILSDYALIAWSLAPAIACATLFKRHHGWYLGLFFGALALVVAPWFFYNYRAGGHVFGVAQWAWLRGTTEFPGDRLDRTLFLNLDAYHLAGLMRRKWLDGMAHAGWISRWCATGEALFPALALPALLLPGTPAGARRLRWPLLAVALVYLVLDPLLAPLSPGRLLYPLLPWMILLGCATLISRMDDVPTWPIVRQALCALLLLLHIGPTVADLLRPREPLPYPPVYPPFVAAVSALVGERELLVSDLPWATAWYGNRRTLWLPNRLAEFYAVNDHRQTVAALYLTTQTGSRPYVGDLLDGDHRDWRPLLDGRLPEGFPLSDGLRLPPGGNDQILLIGSDRFDAGPPAE